MADAQLSVELTAKVDTFVSSINRANEAIKKTGTTADETLSKVDKFSKGGINSIKSMQIQLESYRRIAETATDPKRLVEYNSKVQILEKSISRASNIGKEGFNSIGDAVSKSSGAIGGKLLQGLRTAATILPGIGVAGILAFATEPLIKYISQLDLFKTKLTDIKVAQDDAAQALAGTDYAKAVTNVNELRINIDLARKGFLDKKDVLRQYNETIGKTTGQVKSLDQAEQDLNKNANAFIKFTLLKAAAQIALEGAAKKSYEAEITRRKRLEEFDNKFLDASVTNIRTEEQYKSQQQNIINNRKARQKEEIKISEDSAKQQLSIARKFQEDAAKIAKSNGFLDPLGLGKEKIAKSAKEKARVLGLPENPASVIAQYFREVSAANAPGALKIKAPEKVEIVGTRADLEIGNLVNVVGLDKLIRDLKIAEAFNKEASEILSSGVVETFASIGQAIGDAVVNGGDVAAAAGASLLSTLGSVLIQLGELAIGVGVGIKGIQLALKTLNPFAAIAAGVALVALGSVFKAGAANIGKSGGKNNGVTAFANGGIISGPTLGLMGEYAGAKSDPEVVAPLSKLKKMLGQQDAAGNAIVPTGQQPVYVQQRLEIQGTKLVAMIDTVEQQNKRRG